MTIFFETFASLVNNFRCDGEIKKEIVESLNAIKISLGDKTISISYASVNGKEEIQMTCDINGRIWTKKKSIFDYIGLGNANIEVKNIVRLKGVVLLLFLKPAGGLNAEQLADHFIKVFFE